MRGYILKAFALVAPVFITAVEATSNLNPLSNSDPVLAPQAGPICRGPGSPNNTFSECEASINIPGLPLASFDISWADSSRSEFYLADRSNQAVIIINTATLSFTRFFKGFVGIAFKSGTTTVDADHSGPNGVVTHGRWLYAGDGDSTLKVIDMNDQSSSPSGYIKQTISTNGTARLDEMGLTDDGQWLLTVNNADDPPFLSLFKANGDNPTSSVSFVHRISISPSILPANVGLGMEQSTYDPVTSRFYTSIPTIANNPPGCNYGQLNTGVITCDGGVLVSDPLSNTTVYGPYDNKTRTGVIPLSSCSPNGASLGPSSQLLLGCGGERDTSQLVMNTVTLAFTHIYGVTGTDEAYYDPCSALWYVGSHNDICPNNQTNCAVVGVIDAQKLTFIEKFAQSSLSHSIAVDATKGLLFSAQLAPVATLVQMNITGTGDTTSVGQQICGGVNGCVAVYKTKWSNNGPKPSFCSSDSSNSLSSGAIAGIVVGTVFASIVLFGLIFYFCCYKSSSSASSHHVPLASGTEGSDSYADAATSGRPKYGAV